MIIDFNFDELKVIEKACRMLQSFSLDELRQFDLPYYLDKKEKEEYRADIEALQSVLSKLQGGLPPQKSPV